MRSTETVAKIDVFAQINFIIFTEKVNVISNKFTFSKKN